MAGKKKSKRIVYRLFSPKTGEHYTLRLTREAYDKLADTKVSKFSKKLRKHIPFDVKKVKFKN
ncbi:hypothetical protein KC678_01045 [Candidatus Dojkabacteria bacterium]|uniref:50S ribosomal protein L33 n=1 Tax=Candidatus Dojkabacteria bacterium TaxID=2099670 RepID=A0A955IAF0_9BACT|nr:hypothetical protein [Candidatus Dojkabacteria bacterium]